MEEFSPHQAPQPSKVEHIKESLAKIYMYTYIKVVLEFNRDCLTHRVLVTKNCLKEGIRSSTNGLQLMIHSCKRQGMSWAIHVNNKKIRVWRMTLNKNKRNLLKFSQISASHKTSYANCTEFWYNDHWNIVSCCSTRNLKYIFHLHRSQRPHINLMLWRFSFYI